MDIIWKDIPGYEGLYQVNQWGEVYSLYTGKILKYSLSADGYKQYNLYKNKKNYIMTAHRAVALAFIPNPENLPAINHKDENKENCYYENLEWCSYSYNNKYNDLHIRIAQKNSNTTFQYNKDGSLVETYASSKEAARKNGFNDGCISSCCNEKIHIYKDFVWSYRELTKEEVIARFEKHEETYLFKDGAISKRRKLTDKDVLWIREHYIYKSKEFNVYTLSKKFGVSRRTIECIIHKETYKNI